MSRARNRVREEAEQTLLVPDMPSDSIIEIPGFGTCYNDGSPIIVAEQEEVSTPEEPEEPVQTELLPSDPVEDDTKDGN